MTNCTEYDKDLLINMRCTYSEYNAFIVFHFFMISFGILDRNTLFYCTTLYIHEKVVLLKVFKFLLSRIMESIVTSVFKPGRARCL